jgi:hypothetical protein
MRFSKLDCGLFLSAAVLLVVLIALSVGLWLRPAPQATREMPKGQPPKAPDMQGAIRPLQSRGRPESVRGAISSPTSAERMDVDVDAIVFCNGVLVADVRVGARRIQKDPKGRPHVQFGTDPLLSDEGGAVTLKVAVPKLKAESEDRWALCAYHPEYGTGYREVSLSTLLSGASQRIDLERGQAVTGRVLRKDGLSASGLAVGVGTTWKAGGVSLFGSLCARVADDGRFIVAGIRFDNKPVSLAVSQRIADSEAGQTAAPASRMRFPILESQHRASDGLWDVGDIVFDPRLAEEDRGPAREPEQN